MHVFMCWLLVEVSVYSSEIGQKPFWMCVHPNKPTTKIPTVLQFLGKGICFTSSLCLRAFHGLSSVITPRVKYINSSNLLVSSGN